MPNVLSREASAGLFLAALPAYHLLDTQRRQADAEMITAYHSVLRAQGQIPQPKGWLRLWPKSVGAAEQQAALQKLNSRYKEATYSAKRAAQVAGLANFALGKCAENLPGLHDLFELTYHPKDQNGTPFHTRVRVSAIVDDRRYIWRANAAFSQLRYVTSEIATGGHIMIPRNDDSSPILVYPKERRLWVGVFGGPEAGAYSWKPAPTRSAFPVDPTNFEVTYLQSSLAR